MKRKNIFYFIFILTILATRAWVFFFPQKKLIVGGMVIHHFWLGVILILFVLLLFKKYGGLRMAAFSVGLGLAADELTYIILGGRTVSDYWSIYSVTGTIVILAIVFMTRNWLTRKI